MIYGMAFYMEGWFIYGMISRTWYGLYKNNLFTDLENIYLRWLKWLDAVLSHVSTM